MKCKDKSSDAHIIFVTRRKIKSLRSPITVHYGVKFMQTCPKLVNSHVHKDHRYIETFYCRASLDWFFRQCLIDLIQWNVDAMMHVSRCVRCCLMHPCDTSQHSFQHLRWTIWIIIHKFSRWKLFVFLNPRYNL